MEPDELNSLLGPGHNVPWERIVSICRSFDEEVRFAIMRAIAAHEAECHAHQAHLKKKPSGPPPWGEIHRN